MNSEFSKKLSLLRQERGVSQRTAARDLGISQALLSHYENGIREPGLGFVVRACDYYRVSADFMLGRTLARDGSMLDSEEILSAEDEGHILRGSVMATLQTKLIGGAVSVLFGLLGKLGDKDAIRSAAEYLYHAVYSLYRHMYRLSGGNEALFTLAAEDCGLTAAGMAVAETEYARALRELADQKVKFPDLSAEQLAAAYPGQSQSLTQVLSKTDAALKRFSDR